MSWFCSVYGWTLTSSEYCNRFYGRIVKYLGTQNIRARKEGETGCLVCLVIVLRGHLGLERDFFYFNPVTLLPQTTTTVNSWLEYFWGCWYPLLNLNSTLTGDNRIVLYTNSDHFRKLSNISLCKGG